MSRIIIDTFLDMYKLREEAKKFGFDIKINDDSVVFKYAKNNQILVIDRITNVDIMNGIESDKTVRLYDYNFNLAGYHKFIEYWVDGDLLTKYIIEICFPTLIGITNFRFNQKELQIEKIANVLSDLKIKYVINKDKKYKDNTYVCNQKTHINSNYYLEKDECISFDFSILNKYWGIIINNGFNFVLYSDNSCYKTVFKLPFELFCGIMAREEEYIEIAIRGFVTYINENWSFD